MSNVVEFPQDKVEYSVPVLECGYCDGVMFALSIDGAHCLQCGSTNEWEDITTTLIDNG